MAKSGFWLNGAKGKMAGTTIYQSNGSTVMRVINRSIKNPRTKAQLIQRIITKTVAKQYSAMKEICDHSFEGVKPGADTMARFRSVNNNILRERIAAAQKAGNGFDEIYNFIPLKSTKFIPANVQLSEGSLPQVELSSVTDSVAFSIGNSNTYEGVLNHLGLERGDQLTFVTVELDTNGNYVFGYARVILDPREADGSAAPLSTAFIGQNNNVVKPSFRNEGSFHELVFNQENGFVSFNMKNDTTTAGAVIVSRKVNNEWLRSKAMLVTDTGNLEDDNISLQEALDLAIQGSEIYTDSERFLNNAGVGGPQEETPAP
ncbi:MAG: hypothetical protein IIV77_00045 [Bacteroidaceae bacterium]|nr:hypothetical protein [Bacteroidaceae bacterium]